MSALVHLHEHQSSQAWHEYRNRMGNASEVAALMGCSPWFPRTAHELWLIKTGRAQVERTFAMKRGLDLESRARSYVEHALNEVFEPQVVSQERLSASLDGLSFDGQWVLEIKCPLSGRASATWDYVAANGAPPEHYWWQVQQQLYCAGAAGCHFVVCHAEGGEIVDHLGCEVYPDPGAFEALRQAWDEFFPYMDENRPPPLSEEDVIERADRQWRDAVADWKEARRWLEEARQAEAEARKTLIEVAGAQSTAGAGVRLKRYWKNGDIDWRKATQGMDVEPFRKEGGWHYRITEQE